MPARTSDPSDETKRTTSSHRLSFTQARLVTVHVPLCPLPRCADHAGPSCVAQTTSTSNALGPDIYRHQNRHENHPRYIRTPKTIGCSDVLPLGRRGTVPSG